MSGEHHWNWQGGKPTLMLNGYLYRYAEGKERQYVHRMMAEKVLGRRLTRDEVVHHINAVKTDNRNDNFVLCESGYHRLIERLMATIYQLEHFAHLDHNSAVNRAHEMLRNRQLNLKLTQQAATCF